MRRKKASVKLKERSVAEAPKGRGRLASAQRPVIKTHSSPEGNDRVMAGKTRHSPLK